MNKKYFREVGDKIKLNTPHFKNSVFEITDIDNTSKTFSAKCLKAEGRAKTFFKEGEVKRFCFSLWYEFEKIHNEE
jgi:hypothetical protein